MRNWIQWQRDLEQKIYRRRKKLKKYSGTSHAEYYFSSSAIIQRFYTKFIQQLQYAGYIDDKFKKDKIEVPKNFSFKTNYDDCVVFFKELISSYLFLDSLIVLDFSKCRKSTIACFTVLEVILANLYDITNRYNNNRYSPCIRNVTVIQSKRDVKTNKYLHSFLKVDMPKDQIDDSLFLKLPLQSGRVRNYRESSKAAVTGKVVEFVNESSHQAGVVLNQKGHNALDGLLTEVLGNAEDHSTKNNFWFVDGISFAENQNNTDVVDLNLCIFNLGNSIYEGFEETKEKNAENYSKCDNLYNKHKDLFTSQKKFSRESLFTLYILNEGISRLKYKDSSRGNGTMRFLESFITLGSFGKINPKFKCQLNVISGHTVLTCDNDIRYYEEDNFKKLSLNKEHDMSKLPDSDYLAAFTEKFPGTILECHIYLNKDYFYKILNNNENNKSDERA
jgi:hypothetical protein